MRCSVVTLLHTPHSCMHTPPQEDKCRLLPQPKPVPTEGGEGVGEGEGEEPLLNKMAKEWMSTRDLMKVCVRACMCECVCVCVFVMSNKVDTLSYYLTPLGSVCHMRLALILPQ